MYELDTPFVLHPVVDFTDSIKVWKEQSAYHYLYELDSVLRARKDKAMDEAVNNSSESDGPNFLLRLLESPVLHWILWIIAAAALLFILYKFFINTDFRRLTKKKNKPVEELPEEELPAPGSFEHLIKDAVRKADYRLATRYSFLQTLSILTGNNKIGFANDKTNAAYKRELPEALQSDFAKLAFNYEHIWYGRVIINEIHFREIETLFTQFNQKI